ncbi:MAG TPA: prolyl oligopeptidase family serine peptidase [Saprospiraceae bacterium]|nr:prolyl oligopeptidase family serine peptidase [Saprospiraceae bacterium]
MNKFLPFLIAISVIACKEKEMPKIAQEALQYPETRKDTIQNTFFDTTIIDQYRWLEDDLSTETNAWVDAQNKVTFDYLDKIPFRADYKSRLEKLWNYEKYGAPFKEGKYTYFYKNDGLQNQFVLWRNSGEKDSEIFLDPNTFSKDGTTSLAGIEFSKDGSKVAYQISEGGSDWRKVIIMDADSKKILEDTLIDVKFSGLSWKGNEGFYYSSYDKPKGSELSAKTDQHKLYYHKLGTSQKDDKVIFGEKQKRRYVGGSVTEDERYLFITAATSTSGNELYMIDLQDKSGKLVTLVDNFNSDSYVIENEGTKLFIVTNLNAPNEKIVTTDASNPVASKWVDFIPETENVLSAGTACGYFFAHYMKDALSNIKQYDYTGKLVREVTLPGLGTASMGGAKKDEKDVYFSFTNYITPGSIYKYNPATGASEVYVTPKIDFNPENYESKQVFYTSKDGTKVPMIITHKKGLKLDGNNPAMLYGYGGFNVSITPNFSISNAVWMEQGGIYAVPNLRGGGEYGKKWHDAGTQMKKQNVFDDFIAAAEYLIANKYTSSEYLAIAGGSNGGLLVGACMTQRPDLFKVALPAVGVLDMLRYHTFTAGAGWAYDYGTAEQSKEMLDYLLGYSPVHNVKETSYPATMVTTADHDDRVVPAHSYKFIAELQAKQQGTNPVVIRIDKSAGHGAGKPTSKIIEEAADRYSFALYNMGKSFIKDIKN